MEADVMKRFIQGEGRTTGLLAVVLVGTLLSGCGYLAVATAPSKQAATSRSEAAVNADKVFWETFHSGEYDKIQGALGVLTAAYLDTPDDAITASHVAWLHIWRIAERTRLNPLPPIITDDIVLARKYFQEAVTLNPADARYLGFLGSSMLIEGDIHKDEKLTRRGYYLLLDSIRTFPEFNYFTAGYTMSSRPADSSRFREALDYQWRNLDVCVGETLNRANPDFTQYMSQATAQGSKRVCWNSWIAPHNFEGFFLNMGDMLVKSGDWQTAQKIYANARLSANYETWNFRNVLEHRIRDAQANVAEFNAPRGTQGTRRIMLNSEFSCMACHQR
jgi:hypothetical protein